MTVVVGLGFTGRDGTAFEESVRMAQGVDRSEVRLVHVFDARPSAERSREVLDRLQRFVEARAGTLGPTQGITVGIDLRWGDVVTEIARLAADVHADCIVLGSSTKPPVDWWAVESKEARLLAGVRCPVLMASVGWDPQANHDHKRIAHELEGGASGAIAGAVVGVAAGPPGVVAGAVLGGVVGAMAGAALDTEASWRSAHVRELDAQGVAAR